MRHRPIKMGKGWEWYLTKVLYHIAPYKKTLRDKRIYNRIHNEVGNPLGLFNERMPF